MLYGAKKNSIVNIRKKTLVVIGLAAVPMNSDFPILPYVIGKRKW